MPSVPQWSTWSKFYVISLLLYTALLCFVSLRVFVSALQRGSPLKASDILIQGMSGMLNASLLSLGVPMPRLRPPLPSPLAHHRL